MRSLADLSATKASRVNQHPTKQIAGLCASTVLVFCLLLSPRAVAQEKYLVSTDDGLLSLYDLATNSFVEAVKGSLGLHFVDPGLSSRGVPIPGPSNRVAFDVSGAYVSVIDLTLNRETNRLLRDVFDMSSGDKFGALTPDGRYLVVALLGPFTQFSGGPTLYVVDTARLAVAQKVDLSTAFFGYIGSVVALNNKVYVFPRDPSSEQKVALVNLSTFSVSALPFPSGHLQNRPAVISPDGNAVVALEDEDADNKSHLVFIGTATDAIINDIALARLYHTHSFAMSPAGTNESKTFGYFAEYSADGQTAFPIDLRLNSQTYGQVLSASAVTLDSFYSIPAHGLAVSSDGSRLIVGGENLNSGPNPNVDVIDTDKMLIDPQNAVVARVTVNNGVGAAAVCTGEFTIIPPVTAPTVSAVSGDISNDMPRQIEVTGTNFLAGAIVRIGSMDPLQADVVSSSTLDVTVPANAPAGKALDIIVTNPQPNDPPSQQNQSGLLAGQFSILPNAKFHPANQIATTNLDSSISIYSVAQQTMANVAMPGGSLAPAFNLDGKELYVAGGISFENDLFPVDLKNNHLAAAIPICSTDDCLPSGYVAATRDPSNGNPVMAYVLWDYSGKIHVSIVDSNPASQTFHTVIRSFDVGNNVGYLNSIAASPDGKFCYISYNEDLGIVNLVNGQFTTISTRSLEVASYQNQIGLSPDGKFLLLAAFRHPRYTIKVFDLSNPTQPKRFAELLPVPIPSRGFPYIVNYQIAADRLYATDLAGTVVVFNFNRQKGDFRQVGYFVNPGINIWGAFRVSPDGAYFYASDYRNEQVLVFDTTKLAKGRDGLLTAIRAPYYPYSMDVSPSTPPQRASVRK